MTGTHVNIDNFVRAETDRMLSAMVQQAGGVNHLGHNRTPTPLDQQTVIRMNRDTLMVNQDHCINRILHDAGEHSLTVDEFDTPYVLVAARVFVDPADADDVAEVNALQDRFAVTAGSATPLTPTDYDEESLDATRRSLLELAKGVGGFDRTFGTKGDVDPVRHLIGTAAGWGGLPAQEAYYVGGTPDLGVGEFRLRVEDVPVDGFWSISVYNADGYFVPNDRDAVSIINVTAVPGPDGSVTVHFGGCSDDRANCLPIMEGWNYLVRLYRPRPEVLDGSWTFPGATPVS